MSFFVPGFKEIWLIRVIFFLPMTYMDIIIHISCSMGNIYLFIYTFLPVFLLRMVFQDLFELFWLI